MRRLLAAAGMAAALLLPLTAGAASPPNNGWKMTPWFDAVNSEFWLVTGYPDYVKQCRWTGGAAYVLNENKPDFHQWGCGAPVYYWAKKCTPGTQTVKFTKKVFLPGQPLIFEATLRSLGNRPMKTIELQVNGGVALATTDTLHKRDLKARAGLFKYGWNVITLTARKRASGPCNASKPDTGILLELHAKFGADLEVTSPAPVNNTNALVWDVFTVRNNGPSTISYGSVDFVVNTSKLKVYPYDPNAAVIISAGANNFQGEPLADCSYYGAGSRYSTYCPLPQILAPGQSATFTAHYVYNAPATGDFSECFPVQWGVAGDLFDPNAANSGGQRTRGVWRGAKPSCVP